MGSLRVWVVLLVSSFAFAQSPPVINLISPPTKDPTAVAIAQQALLAMGGSNLANYQDLSASGNITFYGGGNGDITYPIKLIAKGTRELRTDTAKPNGTSVWTSDGNQGCMSYGQIQRPVAFQNLLAQRIDFFPVLSLLAEYANNNVSVQNAGTATVNGRAVYVVALSFTPPGVTMPGILPASLTLRMFYVDQETGLVLKMQFTRYADNAPSSGFMTEMYFSNYQPVNGLMFPMKIDSYFDSQQVSTVSFSAISLNSGLQDSQFSIACGGSYGN